jgi:hypothetical protein
MFAGMKTMFASVETLLWSVAKRVMGRRKACHGTSRASYGDLRGCYGASRACSVGLRTGSDEANRWIPGIDAGVCKWRNDSEMNLGRFPDCGLKGNTPDRPVHGRLSFCFVTRL